MSARHHGPFGGIGWEAVGDDDERKAAIAGAFEHVPGHAVGVACAGRHEDGEVGGLDEAVGEDPVRMLDRVDVGGIDKRQAGRSVFHRAGGARGRRSPPTDRWRLGGVPTAAGRATRIAWRVVGRMTPVGLTGRPTSVLRSVDLPAPVGPTRAMISGASRLWARGRT